MNQLDCKSARDQFALMLYGELSFDEEESVEAHLDTCAECRTALSRQKELHDAIDAAAVTPSPALLNRSRQELSARLDQESNGSGWFRELTSGLRLKWVHPLLQPVGALALLAMGFFGARLAPNFSFEGTQASLVNAANPRVRSVEPGENGQVRIVFDETHQRTISGKMDDQNIRMLLMSASKDAPDADLRTRTVTLLIGDAEEADVRDALMDALAHDRSDSVRTVAMEGLKPYAKDPAVQDVVAQVLLQDANATMRSQAVDLLQARQGADLDRHVVGILQEIMGREDDDYVRDQCRKMLQAMKASPDIY